MIYEADMGPEPDFLFYFEEQVARVSHHRRICSHGFMPSASTALGDVPSLARFQSSSYYSTVNRQEGTQSEADLY